SPSRRSAPPRPRARAGFFVLPPGRVIVRPMSPPLGPASTLYLVDGYALIYRAFFAMIARPLTTRRGENTSAAWGVTNFLLRLLERRRPDYLTWVHDVGESSRHQTYPPHKATRQK